MSAPALGINISLVMDIGSKVYGWSDTPPFARHDQMRNVAASPTAQHSGTRVISSAGILCLEPQPLYGNMATSAFSFDSTSAPNWTTSERTGRFKALLYYPVSPSVDTYAQTISAQGVSAALYFYIERGEPSSSDTSGAPAQYTIIESGVGAPVPGLDSTGQPDYSAGTPFRLIMQDGRPPRLQQAQAIGGVWVYDPDFGADSTVALDGALDSTQLLATLNRQLFIEWLPVPSSNQLVVSIRGIDSPLVFKGKQGAAYPLQVAAGAFRLQFCRGVAGFGMYPMRFTPSGTFTSGTLDLPFVYPGNGFLRNGGGAQPPGTTLNGQIVLADNSGTAVAYTVYLAAPADSSGLATTSPVIRSMGLYVPPTYTFTSYSGGYDDLSSRVIDIRVRQWFDPSNCTIRTRSFVTLDNQDNYFAGVGEGVHYAAQLACNLTVQVSGVQVDYTAPVTQITGWMGMDTASSKHDPARTFAAVIEDGLWQLEQQQVGYVGFFDGWCWLAAIRCLLNLAGISDDWLDPALCTCDFGENPDSCPHYKLPLGVGEDYKVGFHPQATFLDAITQICTWTFSVFWSDQNRIFRVAPYYPGVYTSPYWGTFAIDGSGGANFDGESFLTEMNGRPVTANVSTADRRGGVAFFGIDPSTNEVQGTYLNADDVFGVPGLRSLVEGFRRDLVQVDSRFADPVATEAFAQSAMQRVFLPTVQTEHGATFLPNFFVMNQYNLAPDGTVLTDFLPLTAWSVEKYAHPTDPSRGFSTTIQGRSIYNL